MAAHANLDKQPPEIQARAATGGLNGPYFVGQGLTRRVGSDSYGYYIVEISEDRKTVGLVPSDSFFANDWTGGAMVNQMPESFSLPDIEWITYWRNKWWRAEFNHQGELKRIPGAKACYSWNGAYDYLDPSF